MRVLNYYFKFLFVLKLLLVSYSSIAADSSNLEKWNINPDHSEILFSVDYLLVSKVTGFFKSFSGAVLFDIKKSEPLHLKIDINSKSIFTNNQIRDGHLKSNNFFKVKRYPLITFVSEKVKSIDSTIFLVTGKLKIKQIVRRKTIKVKITEKKDDTWGFKSRFVSFNFHLERDKWDLDWNKSIKGNKLLVGNKVSIDGVIQLQPNHSETPTFKHMLPNTQYINLKDKLNQGEISSAQFEDYTKKFELNRINKKEINEKLKLESSLKVNKEKRKEHLSSDKSEEKNLLWKISFIIMVFFGCCSSILIPIHLKLLLSNKYKEKYQERGLLGFLTDIPVYILGFLYFTAVYIVGQGQF